MGVDSFSWSSTSISISISRNGSCVSGSVASVRRNAVFGVKRSSSRGTFSSMSLMDSISSSGSSSDSGEDSLSAKQLVQKGMQRFIDGNVEGSIEYFDRADAAVPDGSLRPFLWQRGISYYYTNQFQEGSNQFKYDVKVNPLDVEEIVWDIGCLARLHPDDKFPPSQEMSLPKGRTDRRKIMGVVYSLFRGDGATEHDLAMAGNGGSASDLFYSLFYLGLYCEIRGEDSKASNYMKAAAQSPYATGFGSRDYMSSVAKVHCQKRHW
eukprot:CAMPEP_0197827154 /NCGR_PEP_ID=MMETSP1437-20131217/4000_1 /TAXON_ID=49252 ORGANISM="Eucampia antarctica, Strain CCMP1452" /NCGR_SAMPLE_ID=MMETSP1437 /ASSEMBLY_ACC=CAM_ASM_001096 /LENGTH=265 /DNA_ID=CAMNT_0043427899 /DNA_START=159 /DNA_END=956 /DNA_ORIENTATION=-